MSPANLLEPTKFLMARTRTFPNPGTCSTRYLSFPQSIPTRTSGQDIESVVHESRHCEIPDEMACRTAGMRPSVARQLSGRNQFERQTTFLRTIHESRLARLRNHSGAVDVYCGLARILQIASGFKESLTHQEVRLCPAPCFSTAPEPGFPIREFHRNFVPRFLEMTGV